MGSKINIQLKTVPQQINKDSALSSSVPQKLKSFGLKYFSFVVDVAFFCIQLLL